VGEEGLLDAGILHGQTFGLGMAVLQARSRGHGVVHYTSNEIGDYQTGAATHHGLTPLGAEVIRACHRLDLLVDIAHGTEAMVKQALRVASKPATRATMQAFQ